MVDFGGSSYMDAIHRVNKDPIAVHTRDLGISRGMGDVLTGLQADIKAGAKHVELGFVGRGKGSLGQGQTTPEMFDKEKRKEIRRLAKLNDVTVSTHSSVGIQGFTGLDTQNRRFSDTAARETLSEVKRTVDFAGEACGGGAVVVHTGEFPREVSEYKDFEPPEGIQKEEIIVLVDKETGNFANIVNKGDIVNAATFQKNEKGQYIDYHGNPTDDLGMRMPVVDEATGQIQFKEKRWGNFLEEAKKKKRDNPEKYRGFSDSEVAAKDMHIESQMTELERAAPFAHQHLNHHKQLMDRAKKLDELQGFYEKAEKSWDQTKLKRHFQMQYGEGMGYEMAVDGTPSEFLKKQVTENLLDAKIQLEGYKGYAKQMEQIRKLKDRVEPISKMGKQRAAENMAEAAMYAIKKEEQLKRAGRKDVEPIYIAPENMFPEHGYGAHPEELKKLVLSARRELTKRLRDERNMGKSEAKKVADEHIKATFDIGHANVWRRFFKEEKGETIEQTNERFNEWLLKQVDDLNKNNIIGHAHLSDNFGYQDEHLTLGEGSAPVAEFIQKMKKAGLKEPMVVEYGAQAEGESAMLGAWSKMVNSPMYRVDGIKQTWSDVEHSGYFGRTSSPTFITGNYGPSKEWNAWGWSETPIE
jgi:sugar phosphate isomerase/epimerase